MNFETPNVSPENKKEEVESLYNEEGRVNDPEIAESMAHAKDRLEKKHSYLEGEARDSIVEAEMEDLGGRLHQNKETELKEGQFEELTSKMIDGLSENEKNIMREVLSREGSLENRFESLLRE